jgi:DNA-binding GntR family transcriptional regulator
MHSRRAGRSLALRNEGGAFAGMLTVSPIRATFVSPQARSSISTMSYGTIKDAVGVHLTELGQLPSRRGQITETLRAAIISGEMKAGVIYSAPTLAAEFGVSPTPVREAMLRLANEGLIDVVRNKGFRVVEPSEGDLDEVLELRFLLEIPTVGRIARDGLTPKSGALLMALAKETVAAASAGDITGHVVADNLFHLELLRFAGNEQLVELVAMLRSRSRLFGLASPTKGERLIAISGEHVELVKLISDRNEAAAKRLMKEHITHVRKDWAKEDA